MIKDGEAMSDFDDMFQINEGSPNTLDILQSLESQMGAYKIMVDLTVNDTPFK